MYSQEVSALTADAISDPIVPDELTDDMVKAFNVEKPFTYATAFVSVSNATASACVCCRKCQL